MMTSNKIYIAVYFLIVSSLLAAATASHKIYAPSEPLSLYNVHNLKIVNESFENNDAVGITLNQCSDIMIKGNFFSNLKNVGIYLYHCKNITIEENSFSKVSSGVYADHDKGGIVVVHNQFQNMEGPYPRGQFVQFNNVSGANNSISYNKGENFAGESNPEDAISLYQSEGTPESPIKIKGNWIRGGGPSASGGGIMLGDNGGSYLLASDNILVDPGEYGMAIAGGDHNSMINNSIYGKKQNFTNVGIYINGINGQICTKCIISGNRVRFYNKVNYENNAWIAPGTVKPEGWGTNVFGAKIDANILPPSIINIKE